MRFAIMGYRRCVIRSAPFTDAVTWLPRSQHAKTPRSSCFRCARLSFQNAGQDRFGALYRIYYRDAFGALLVFDLSRPETFQSVLKVGRENAELTAVWLNATECRMLTCVQLHDASPTCALQWKREIDNKVTLPNGSPLPVVLLANKCDLPDTRVNKEELDAFCKVSSGGAHMGIAHSAMAYPSLLTCFAAASLLCPLQEHGFIGWFETSAKTNHNIEESVKGLVTNILSHPDAFEAHRLKTQAAAADKTTLSLAEDKPADKKADKTGCC